MSRRATARLVLTHPPPWHDGGEALRHHAGLHSPAPLIVVAGIGDGVHRISHAAQDGAAALGRLGFPVRTGQGVDGQQLVLRLPAPDIVECGGMDGGADVILPYGKMVVPAFWNGQVPPIGQIVLGDGLPLI